MFLELFRGLLVGGGGGEREREMVHLNGPVE